MLPALEGPAVGVVVPVDAALVAVRGALGGVADRGASGLQRDRLRRPAVVLQGPDLRIRANDVARAVEAGTAVVVGEDVVAAGVEGIGLVVAVGAGGSGEVDLVQG